MIPEELGSLIQWLANEFAERKKSVAVVGVSGGIDSAVVYRLCQKAGLTLSAIYMPFSTTVNESASDMEYKLCQIAHNKVYALTTGNMIQRRIDSIADAYMDSTIWVLPDLQRGRVRCGNFCARIRMAILYDHAAYHNGLVVGTSNATEIALGYGTRHGDCACDINPIANLYKREVRQLAEWLDVPKEIRDAVPSADLWEGQTDEGELGFTYEDADNYLMGIPYRHLRPDGVTPEVRAKIEARIEANKFKSEPVPCWIPGNYAR